MIKPSKIFGRLGNSMFQYAYLVSQVRDGIIPDYYLQDEKYFVKHKDFIKTLFGTGIEKIDMVAIHVRRGDYVGNNFYTDLIETDYYDTAMKEFPNAEFLVFSDDIEFCKKLWGDRKGFSFSEGKTEIEDLNLMASCVGHIIANSSYSFWGAYLSPHGGKVVAPKYWYSDKLERTIIPKYWIKI